MCGIFGAIGKLPEGVLELVSASIAHRGPDGEGYFVDGQVTLLHRRLKIIDLSDNAVQPMFNEDGSIVLVFNGEIYNHRILQDELKRAGHQFRSRSDTEVIIHGYEEWGDDVVRHIQGMFAFGIWDIKRRRLLLARDRTGKKPLYFTELGGTFRFASEIKAIEASGVATKVAVDKLPFYLSFGFVPAPYTIHAGVMQLPPASRMVVDEHGAHPSEVFWEPRFGEPGKKPSFAEASHQVRQLVERAVERRLESDVPLGAFLSGGIDSSIMVGLMARLSGQRVRTFSIGFADDPRNDETPYARLAAKTFATEHTEFILEPSSFELVEKLVWLHDGPFGDASAIPTYVMSGLTRQHVTVSLSGEGGDELFCGYPRFIAGEAAEHVPAWTRNFVKQATSLIPDYLETSWLGQARRVAQAASLPLVERLTRWNSFLPGPAELLRADVAAELGDTINAPLAWQYEVFDSTRGQTMLSRILEHNFRTYLPYVLLKKADRSSMGQSLEIRAPFLDQELIEYAAALPPMYLRRGLETKRILKHAFRDLLPPAILKRGKMGFGPPLASWLRGSLRGYLFDNLTGQARIYDYLDRLEIIRLLDEHRLGIADHGQRLWTLLTLEIWLRTRAQQGQTRE